PDSRRIGWIGPVDSDTQALFKVLDAGTGQTLATHPDPGPRLGRIAFSPDGRRLAMPTGDQATVYDAGTLGRLFGLSGHHPEASVTCKCVVYSPDGTRIATAS